MAAIVCNRRSCAAEGEGPRPLIDDDSVRSQDSLIFNARAGYRFDNGVRLQLDVLNLFNAKTNQIEWTTS
jgi:hypothetical protein